MQPNTIQIVSAACFFLAIMHTFLVKKLHHFGKRFPKESVMRNVFYLLGEVEIVFGLWSAVLLVAMVLIQSAEQAIGYLEARNFTEPAFVFVILVVCSTQPILDFAESLLMGIAKVIPLKPSLSFFVTALTFGPILGSFITEPAAMTIVALLLLNRFYKKNISRSLKYAVLGVLFVNVSIGGTLTHYAAPPVLMVAGPWNWGLKEMFFTFGWKGALACLISTSILAYKFRKEISAVDFDQQTKLSKSPRWVQVVHLLFLIAVVLVSHHTILVVGLFLFFLGFVGVTNAHQETLRIKEGLLVSFFLAGLVVLGGMQEWWIAPLITNLSALPLYLGAIGLTAITDNAALTYLGSLVPDLAEASKFSLLAGAVVGGGLTVIANAPNPAGYNILNPAFGEDGISALGLFKAALIPTIISGLCFWFL